VAIGPISMKKKVLYNSEWILESKRTFIINKKLFISRTPVEPGGLLIMKN